MVSKLQKQQCLVYVFVFMCDFDSPMKSLVLLLSIPGVVLLRMLMWQLLLLLAVLLLLSEEDEALLIPPRSRC